MTRIAAVQFTGSHDTQANLAIVEKWVSRAAQNGAKVVVLPENFALMGKLETDKLKLAEPFGEGLLQDFLRNLSKSLRLWIVGGTIPLISPMADRVCASSLVFNDQGQCVARYDKIHLFDVDVGQQEIYRESSTIYPGKEVISINTPFAILGLTVCYDLRFPELYRQLFNEGVEIFVVPSAFTQKTGQAHWEVLLRARAIENFCYVVAPNQTGHHSNGRDTFGHSMIIDPWGKILQVLPEGEGFVMADIDLAYLKDIRRRFPVKEHQRLGKV